MFRWAVSRQMVGPELVIGLELLPLQAGRCSGSPSRSRRSRSPIWRPSCRTCRWRCGRWWTCSSGPVAGPVRPSDARRRFGHDRLRGRRRAVWVYRPAEHKTEHHGQDRVIYLGPKAQAVVRPRLTGKPTAPLFMPHATGWRTAITVSGYRQAIGRAWDKPTAGVACPRPVAAGRAGSAGWPPAGRRDGLRRCGGPKAEPGKAERKRLNEGSRRHSVAYAAALTARRRPSAARALAPAPAPPQRRRAVGGRARHRGGPVRPRPRQARHDPGVFSEAHLRKAAEVMGKSG